MVNKFALRQGHVLVFGAVAQHERLASLCARAEGCRESAAALAPNLNKSNNWTYSFLSIVILSSAPISATEIQLRIKVLALLLLFAYSALAFAAPKASKKSTSSGGILLAASYYFAVWGDGISTSFTLTPWKVPQPPGSAIPRLPLVGSVPNSAYCYGSGATFTVTASGERMIITFAAPPPADTELPCSLTLLFQPE